MYMYGTRYLNIANPNQLVVHVLSAPLADAPPAVIYTMSIANYVCISALHYYLPLPYIPAPFAGARSAVQLSSKFPGDGLEVHEVTEASTRALSHLILSTTCLSTILIK